MRYVVPFVALTLFAGCSADEADIPAIERTVEEGIRDQAGEQVTVDCPDTMEWRAGDDFRCVVEDGAGNRARVTIYMENDAGDITWQIE